MRLGVQLPGRVTSNRDYFEDSGIGNRQGINASCRRVLHIAVDALDEVVVSGEVAARGNGLDAISLVQEVVPHHLGPWRILVLLRLNLQQCSTAQLEDVLGSAPPGLVYDTVCKLFEDSIVAVRVRLGKVAPGGVLAKAKMKGF